MDIEKGIKIPLNGVNLYFLSTFLKMKYQSLHDSDTKLDVRYNNDNSGQILISLRKTWVTQTAPEEIENIIKQEMAVNIPRKEPGEAWISGFKVPGYIKMSKLEKLNKEIFGFRFTNQKPSTSRSRKYNFYIFHKVAKGWIILKYTSDKPIEVSKESMIKAINIITTREGIFYFILCSLC